MSDAEIDALLDAIGTDAVSATVDLEKCAAVIAGHTLTFELDPVWQEKLVNGWDDIDLTTQHNDRIKDFRTARFAAHPWAVPAS